MPSSLTTMDAMFEREMDQVIADGRDVRLRDVATEDCPLCHAKASELCVGLFTKHTRSTPHWVKK